MATLTAGCFHCGLPLPARGRFRATVLGAERELCCAGCHAVATTIVGSGLERYYATRTSRAAPPTQAALQKQEFPDGQASAFLVLEGVRCAACLWLIEQALRRAPGVRAAEVNYTTERAHVSWDPAAATLEAIVAAVRAVGYGAAPYDAAAQAALERKADRAALWRLFVAGFGAMQVMMYAFPAYVDGDAATFSADSRALMNWAGLLVTLPVLFVSCAPFFRAALAELRAGRLGLDAPIALGIAGAFGASAWATLVGEGAVYFDSISMLVFVVLGARYAQRAVSRAAGRRLDALHRAAGGACRPGEIVRVAPGERIPADGVVVEGASGVDESLLTGESRPIAKRVGDELAGGSVNLDQPLALRVTRAGAGTRAALVAALAERAAAVRPRLVEAASRAAQPLTLLVLAVAAAVLFARRDLWSAVAVLVVACPCALALASPLVLTRATAHLLSRGVLVTRTRALQALERATDVLFDKTGTLTRGNLRLVRTHAGEEGGEACRALAAALEATSRHPIARAFGAAPEIAVESVTYHAGQGVEGSIAGRRLRLGAEGFCRELCGRASAFPEAQERRTRVFLADAGGFLAAFDLEDELRPEAAALVRELKRRGLRVHLVSGDSPAAAAAAARAVGIERSTGGMQPEAKLAHVRALQAEGRIVVMVGDGLNDAPVLAGADASFAMGGGADSAQLRADLVLLGSSLAALPAVLDASRRAMRLVRQNVAWALAYNALGIPLAALGLVGPLEAALGMGASSIAVLLNALRPLHAPGSRTQSWKASTSSSPSPSASYS